MIVSGSCSFWKGFSLVVKYRLVLERGLIFKEFRTKSTIVLLNCWIVGCFQSRACLPSPTRTLSQKYNLNLRIKTELVTAGADLKYLNWYLDHKQDICIQKRLVPIVNRYRLVFYSDYFWDIVPDLTFSWST